MSLIRDPATITKVGKQLITAGGDITYTKATLYNQDISHLTKEQLENLTSLGSPVMTVPVGISDKSEQGESTTIVLEATFQNTGLKADTPYKAIGFFARKGDDAEKLVILGVANSGAYLAAASPDGVATDALDMKVSIAIGDATSVTAVVDPAGSVTPATLNGAINKLDHDLTAKIDANQDSTNKALDTKADKATVESDLATKANQLDLDKTNAEVAKKADSQDVKDQLAASVKSLTDSIATKADAKTVNDAISKIDFTPYARKVDVYSRAELDKKLLALSTDTSGKVNADQVADMLAGKADKTDVTAELAKKDDITDVDAKIKTVTDLVNTKANSSDVYNQSDIDATVKDISSTIATVNDKATNATNLAAEARSIASQKANISDVYTKNETFDKSSIANAFENSDKKITDAVNLAKQAQDTANTKASNADVQSIQSLISDLRPDNNAESLPDGYDLNNHFQGWRRAVNTDIKNRPWASKTDTFYFGGNIDGNDGLIQIAINIGQDNVSMPKMAIRSYAWGRWTAWSIIANDENITSLQNTKVDKSQVNVDGNLFARITWSNFWYDILPNYNNNQARLESFRDESQGGHTLGNYAAGIAFGGGDTKGVLNVAYSDHTARIIGGNGNSPVWHEDIAWKSDISDLRNQVQQLRETQFEVQTFTDDNAAKNWENQRPGKRMAIVNK